MTTPRECAIPPPLRHKILEPPNHQTGVLIIGEISSDLYHALQCDIEISKLKSFELEKK